MRQCRHSVALSLLFLSGLAAAQVPGALRPGQIERAQQVPRDTLVVPDIAPAPSAPWSPPTPPAAAARLRLVLRELNFEGVTVYLPAILRAGYQAEIGKEIPLSRVYEIAAELTARYRNDGYILSQVLVPAQNIKDGVVTLQAVEGYIKNVSVQGSDNARRLAQPYLAAITQARPLTAAALERYLLLLNDVPGLAARATLAPSDTQGAADLTAVVTEDARSFSVGLNNRNSRLLGPWRANLDADFNAITGADHLGLKLLRTPTDPELTMGSLQYDRLIGHEGLKFSLSASKLQSQPEPSTALPDLRSQSQTGSLGLSYALQRSRLQNLHLRLNYSLQDGNTDSSGAPLFSDHIRAVRLGASLDLVDGLRGINTFDAEFSQGLNSAGATPEGDPLASRAGATPTFQKFTYYAARLQSLAPRWSMLLALTGQQSNFNLLSPEQFAFGGNDFGRGYDASELTGDSGAAGKLELRYSLPGNGWLQESTGYVFADRGCIKNNTALPDTDCAGSAGLGLRFSARQRLSGFVEYARPLDHDISAEGNRNARLFAGLNLGF